MLTCWQGLKRSLELEKKKNFSVDAEANRLLDEMALTSGKDLLQIQQDFRYFTCGVYIIFHFKTSIHEVYCHF